MKSILFVFSSVENRHKYQSFLNGIKDYGYSPEVVLLNSEQTETQQIDREYQLIFSDYLSQNPNFLPLKNLTVEDVISDINTFYCSLS